jgi:hypothetical protein
MSVKIELEENEAWEFAQFLKRITWEGVMRCAVDKANCEFMIRVIEDVREQMGKQGCAPR